MRLFAIFILSLILSGCGKHLDSEPAKQPDTVAVSDSIGRITKAADSIDVLAGVTVPEVKAQTAIQRTEADHLTAENKKTEGAIRTLKATQSELRVTKEEGNRLVSRCIAGAYVLGIIGIVLGFVLKAPSIVLGGVGALVGAAVATFVLKWAWVFGIVAVVGALLWYLFVQRKAIKEVVTTTEVAKRLVAQATNGEHVLSAVFSAPDSTANQIQSPATQSIVSNIRAKFNQSAPAQAPAPTETGGGAA
jgi:TM2 domain-containing membrane protein YozV